MNIANLKIIAIYAICAAAVSLSMAAAVFLWAVLKGGAVSGLGSILAVIGGLLWPAEYLVFLAVYCWLLGLRSDRRSPACQGVGALKYNLYGY